MSARSLIARLGAAVEHVVEHGANRLGWGKAYRAVSYLRSALWVAPITAVLLALVLIRVLHLLDRFVTWDLTGLGRRRRPDPVPDPHHAHALVRRLHVRLAAGRDPDRERPAHAAHHRHHAAARSRDQVHGRAEHVHAAVRGERAQPYRGRGAAAGDAGRRAARRRLRDLVPVPDRLHRAPAAAGAPGGPGVRARIGGHSQRLPGRGEGRASRRGRRCKCRPRAAGACRTKGPEIADRARG